MTGKKYMLVLIAVLSTAVVLSACSSGSGDGGTGVAGTLNISGSSTVEPISSLVAEKFQSENPDVQVAVDGPGTSDGFALFCNGETDINDASRQIKDEEIQACQDSGVNYVELAIARDALTVIGNPANPIECLNFGDLYSLLGPESEGFNKWSDADALAAQVGGNGGFPDASLTVVAPGEESGTYNSFIDLVTKGIAETRGASEDSLRPDYQIASNDNVIIQNAEDTTGALGFVGFAYAQQAEGQVKEFKVAGEDGNCVAPSAATVVDGTYPLARTLYIYVNTDKISTNAALKSFVDFYLSADGLASATEVGYVSAPESEIAATKTAWDSASA